MDKEQKHKIRLVMDAAVTLAGSTHVCDDPPSLGVRKCWACQFHRDLEEVLHRHADAVAELCDQNEKEAEEIEK